MKKIKQALHNSLIRRGYHIRKIRPHERKYHFTSHNEAALTDTDQDARLNPENPRIQELRDRYRRLDIPATASSKWDKRKIKKELDLRAFRGDNVYVWQYRLYPDNARMRFYLYMLDVRSNDKLNLLSRLGEDGAFGCWTFRFKNGKAISRDLLDSVNEINYINAKLDIEGCKRFRVLDIGAGYGRLAHRMCEAFPHSVAYDCIDAIPESTFLSEYYLDFRGITGRARSVPLDEYHTLPNDYDIAVNIHSFSECPRQAIQWWLQLLRERKIKYLLIVPNKPKEFLSAEPDGSKVDFYPDIIEAGYELYDSQPVHTDPDLRELIGLHYHFFLFRFRDSG